MKLIGVGMCIGGLFVAVYGIGAAGITGGAIALIGLVVLIYGNTLRSK